jgi:hypothetical protein
MLRNADQVTDLLHGIRVNCSGKRRSDSGGGVSGSGNKTRADSISKSVVQTVK